MKRLIALLAILLILPTAAQAWWNKDWTVRKQVTLDTQMAGVSTEASAAVVLVRLSTGNFDFLAAKEDGSDIRFLAEDDATPLKFHIERFDKINELAYVWVQVPKLAGNNKTQHIWVYVGNEKAPAVEDSKSTYDASHLMVLHLNETQGLPQDATANGVRVTQGNVAYVTGGLVAGAARLSGDGGLFASSPALQTAKEFTISAWFKPTQADGSLFELGNVAVKLVAGVPVLAVGSVSARAAEPMPLNAWHHVAVVAGQGLILYVDGKAVANASGAVVPADSVRVGGGLVGELDEVLVSTVARPAAWVTTQVESQGQAGRLVKVGEEQSAEGGESTSYFAATMRNVTVDGWVVVGLCAFMFVVAVWVMVAKAIFLSQVEKSNRGFEAAFAEMSRGMAEADENAAAHAGELDHLVTKKDQFLNSSLYRIYEVGVKELKSRFPKAAAGQGMPVISSRSIEAVRATLDAQLVREGQRMNKAMVLLTIAISGGPFLGLLGTVVGVMITFAAIAAAGDVNVNAIAPGIAAALVATVAGLGVAIPALFGYNYLMTKIKDVSADMHVFVDEFVTKMAENYGG